MHKVPKMRPLLLMRKPNPLSVLFVKAAKLKNHKISAASIEPAANDGRKEEVG